MDQQENSNSFILAEVLTTNNETGAGVCDTSSARFSFTFIFKLISISILIFSFLIIMNANPSFLGESAILILFSSAGLLLLMESSDLIGFYLAVELYSLSAYILATKTQTNSPVVLPHNINKISTLSEKEGGQGLQHLQYGHDHSSVSAGLKYFLLSALTSGLLVLGISLIYGSCGELEFDSLSRILNFTLTGGETSPSPAYPLTSKLELGISIVMVTLLFKLGSAPFHYWLADVYGKVSLLVNSYMIIVPKVAILFVLVKLLLIFPQPLSVNLLISCSVLSLLVGSFGGLMQLKIRRVMAFSSINHVGYILLALSSVVAISKDHRGAETGTESGKEGAFSAPYTEGVVDPLIIKETISNYATLSPSAFSSLWLYIIIYSLMVANFFFILLQKECSDLEFDKKGDEAFISSQKRVEASSYTYLDEFKGLVKKNLFIAITLAITVLSMAGVPPLAGFVAKLNIYYAILDSQNIALAVFAVLCSVVSAVYYLRIIKISFFLPKTLRHNEADGHSHQTNTCSITEKIEPYTVLKAEKGGQPSRNTLASQLFQSPSDSFSTFSALVSAFITLFLVFYPLLNPSLMYLFIYECSGV